MKNCMELHTLVAWLRNVIGDSKSRVLFEQALNIKIASVTDNTCIVKTKSSGRCFIILGEQSNSLLTQLDKSLLTLPPFEVIR